MERDGWEKQTGSPGYLSALSLSPSSHKYTVHAVIEQHNCIAAIFFFGLWHRLSCQLEWDQYSCHVRSLQALSRTFLISGDSMPILLNGRCNPPSRKLGIYRQDVFTV